MVLSLVVIAGFESSLGSTFTQPARLIDEPETEVVADETNAVEATDSVTTVELDR